MFTIMLICMFTIPLSGWADQCAETKKEAHKIFGVAQAASKQENYAEAIELYESALELFTKVTKMTDCKKPANRTCAGKNIPICKNNIKNNKTAIENKAKYEKNVESYEIYNQGKVKYNEGTKFAKNRQWEQAINAFKEAEDLWDSITSNETENGRKAIKSSELAYNSAMLAKKRMDQSN